MKYKGLIYNLEEVSMKKLIKLLSFVLTLSAIHLTLYSELLIVKKTNDGFASLDSFNDHISKDINSVLLKYQWPMVIRSQLNSNEQNDLLTSGNARAEEIFIQQKLIEQTGNDQLNVVFFPTALYELFIMSYILKEGPLRQAVNAFLLHGGNIDIEKILKAGKKESADIIRKNINEIYENIDSFFYNGSENARSYINQEISTMLFALYPEFANARDASALSDMIHIKSDELTSKLIDQLSSLKFSEKPLTFNNRNLYRSDCVKSVASSLADEQKNKIIIKDIALEYEARKLNKGLVLRGTSFDAFKMWNIGGSPEVKVLAGSTIHKATHSYEKPKAYSISFGNSLFGGCLSDCGACAYSYLGAVKTRYKASGYGILIDKKDYIQHNNSNLFFIAPLSSIASLFENGEWFHSRTKPALAKKDNIEGNEIIGVANSSRNLIDPFGIFVITRDPLKHNALFSQFIADNGRIIQKGDESSLSPEEKKFVEDVKSAQIEVSTFYKQVQFLKPKMQNIATKAKQKVALAQALAKQSAVLAERNKTLRNGFIIKNSTDDLILVFFEPKESRSYESIDPNEESNILLEDRIVEKLVWNAEEGRSDKSKIKDQSSKVKQFYIIQRGLRSENINIVSGSVYTITSDQNVLKITEEKNQQ